MTQDKELHFPEFGDCREGCESVSEGSSYDGDDFDEVNDHSGNFNQTVEEEMISAVNKHDGKDKLEPALG